MATPLALDKKTIEEKLQTMEALWDDLCQHEEALPVHDWQKEILDGRNRMIERGDSKFSDWEEAKKRIAKDLMRLEILDQAAVDLVEGFRFYEDQGEELGS